MAGKNDRSSQTAVEKKTNRTSQTAYVGKQPKQPSQKPASTPSGGGGYGGYGGGGGGGGYSGKTPAQQQKETQAQIDNQGDIYLDRKRAMDKEANEALGNLNKQIAQNQSVYNEALRKSSFESEWQPQQQREQSTLNALRRKLGTGAYGSGSVDLIEGMERYDDMSDKELIDTYKQNQANAFDNWLQTDTSLRQDYNEQVNQLTDEYSKLKSQYWTGISNIAPLLASKKNMDKAARNQVTKKQVANAKKTVKQLGKTKALSKMQKSALKSAKAIIKKSKAKVSAGKGTDKYYLPNISLAPSAATSALLKSKDLSDTRNPYVGMYYRPDDAVRKAEAIPNTGGYNTENKGFLDSLNAYNRRV